MAGIQADDRQTEVAQASHVESCPVSMRTANGARSRTIRAIASGSEEHRPRQTILPALSRTQTAVSSKETSRPTYCSMVASPDRFRREAEHLQASFGPGRATAPPRLRYVPTMNVAGHGSGRRSRMARRATAAGFEGCAVVPSCRLAYCLSALSPVGRSDPS
jgi:hypothetical protein